MVRHVLILQNIKGCMGSHPRSQKRKGIKRGTQQSISFQNIPYLLKLVRDEVDAQWELFNVGELVTELVDTKLWVWHTTVEPRLWVRLVLTVPVASSWTTTHSDDCRGRRWGGGRGREKGG